MVGAASHLRVSLMRLRPIFQDPHDCNRECAGVAQTRDRDTPLQAHARTELARGFPALEQPRHPAAARLQKVALQPSARVQIEKGHRRSRISLSDGSSPSSCSGSTGLNRGGQCAGSLTPGRLSSRSRRESFVAAPFIRGSSPASACSTISAAELPAYEREHRATVVQPAV